MSGTQSCLSGWHVTEVSERGLAPPFLDYIPCCVGNYHLPSFQSLHELYRELRVGNIIPLRSLEADHMPHQKFALNLDSLQAIWGKLDSISTISTQWTTICQKISFIINYCALFTVCKYSSQHLLLPSFLQQRGTRHYIYPFTVLTVRPMALKLTSARGFYCPLAAQITHTLPPPFLNIIPCSCTVLDLCYKLLTVWRRKLCLNNLPPEASYN